MERRGFFLGSKARCGAAVAILVLSGWFTVPRAFEAAEVWFAPDDDPVPMTEYRLGRVAEHEYVETVEHALAEDDVELARSVIAVAEGRGVALPGDLRARVEAAAAASGGVLGDIWTGVTTGEAQGWAGFSAAVVSDFLVVGDIRDLVEQSAAYPDHDSLTVALAATGLALTAVTAGTVAATAFTVGAAAPSAVTAGTAKAGVSFLKVARKLGKLRPRFAGDMADIARKSIDGDALRSIGPLARAGEWGAVRGTARTLVRKEAIDEIGATAGRLGGIAHARGPRAAMQTLETAESTRQLKNLARLSDRYGPRYRGVLALVAGAGKALVWGSALLLSLLSAMAAGMLWLFSSAFLMWRIGRFLWPRRPRHAT